MSAAEEILACPRCSHPRAKMFSRPTCYPGRQSGIWFIIAGTNCHCIDTYAEWNRAESAAPLIDFWNQQATATAATLSAERGHTPEQAADFLRSLRPKNYLQDGVQV